MTSPETRSLGSLWDVHIHVIGPKSRFPLDVNRPYDAEDAPLSMYEAVAGEAGVGAALLIQPSFYGDDHSCLLNALADSSSELLRRGVAAAPGLWSTSTLQEWSRAGVVAVRVNRHHGADHWRSAVEHLDMLAESNMHMEVYARPGDLSEIYEVARDSPVPVVLDHLGGVEPADPESVRSLKRLMDLDRVWVKVVPYVVSSNSPRHDDVGQLVAQLAGHRADRLLWGSNWPHPVPGLQPIGEKEAIRQLVSWVPPESADQILSMNAETLYHRITH